MNGFVAQDSGELRVDMMFSWFNRYGFCGLLVVDEIDGDIIVAHFSDTYEVTEFDISNATRGWDTVLGVYALLV